MNKQNGHTTAAVRISPELNLFQETVIRLLLFAIYIYFEIKDPFIRQINPDEMWLYKNPRTDSYVPLTALYPSVFGFAAVVFLVYYFRTGDFNDFKSAWLGLTLACSLNGVITHSIKVAVGRPRPDFYWRCFPDGVMNADMVCSGDSRTVMDGRKSFPSGHASFAFAALAFISCYLCAKLHVFTERGRGQSWRLLTAGAPLLAATLVAISRTCDYHHHWQDVTVGSLIGLVEAYLCYRQYYPPMESRFGFLPYMGDTKSQSTSKTKSESPIVNSDPDSKMLLGSEDKDNKWT
ncbi:phospholipid phosphatase 5 [Topomyia yanbarensis]|uniref:phospholipid phosphatase 5 n=1 Tax=Topomyia yanbarensis TaxID=2498891 RepID=UPI00273BFF72|nr:phospholipid phosphatase 5 [Topomyia yanbarensis]